MRAFSFVRPHTPLASGCSSWHRSVLGSPCSTLTTSALLLPQVTLPLGRRTSPLSPSLHGDAGRVTTTPSCGPAKAGSVQVFGALTTTTLFSHKSMRQSMEFEGRKQAESEPLTDDRSLNWMDLQEGAPANPGKEEPDTTKQLQRRQTMLVQAQVLTLVLAHRSCNHSHKTIQHSSTGRWQAW